MKVSRTVLEKDLGARIESVIENKKALQGFTHEAKRRFDVPEKLFTDFITQRRNIIEADSFLLFILTEILMGEGSSEKYFTDIECNSLSKAKWHTAKVKFPLCFDVTRINDTHYVGATTVKDLMLLKDAQLINYNENAQRTMKHITRGEMEYYQIALNKEAVNEIMESYDSELYIPNTITLNLPEDAEYSYDVKKKQLIIHRLEYFDILDGYHRYIAMSKKVDKNPDWNYEMELRIVQFSEEKARRFIWQEDQKTKMRKIDSDSMDVAKVSNKIVDRLNNTSRFILSGRISRNKGIINAAYFSNIIDLIYLRKIKKSEELKAMKAVSSEIMDVIEEFTDMYPEYLDKAWDKLLTYMVCYEGKYGDIKNIKKDLEKVRKENNIYAMSTLTKADITRTHKLLGKEGY